jgi:hypothetical protein
MSNANVTILTDENGVLREYREVKRKANVGERIKMTDTYDVGYDAGDVFSVRNVDTLGRARFYDNDGDERAAYAHRYVVLEPTDVVIIDGVRYREERRKARVGERVLITYHKHDLRGKVAVVRCFDRDGDAKFEPPHQGFYAEHDWYVVLTPIDEPKAETTTTPAVYNVTINVTVNGTVDDVAQAIADAMKRELTKMSAQEFVSHAEELLGLAKSAQQPAAQCLRDEIVERAKRDIGELKTTHYPTLAQYYAEFIVNREKRTVVCLLRAQRYDGKGKVVSRGIAKCAPDDCFNVHIGKAIALRRALGLPVPVKYLNAPQPTEVRVGDVVEITGNQQSGHFYHYYSIGDTGRVDKVGRYEGEIVVTPVKTKERKWPGYYQNVSLLDVKIIDDSREETEVSA